MCRPTMKMWYQQIFMGDFMVGGVLMVLLQKLDYVYIIVNIFCNTHSILKILASKRNNFALFFYHGICTLVSLLSNKINQSLIL